MKERQKPGHLAVHVAVLLTGSLRSYLGGRSLVLPDAREVRDRRILQQRD